MLKRLLYTFVLLIIATGLSAFGQDLPPQLKDQYETNLSDTAKANMLDQYLLTLDKVDLFRKADELSSYFKKNGDEASYDYVQLIVSNEIAQQGNYTEAVKRILGLLSRFESRKDSLGIMKATIGLSVAYAYANDKEHTLAYDRKAIRLALAKGGKVTLANTFNNVAADFTLFGMPDSALAYAKKALQYARESGQQRMISLVSGTLGEVYIAKKQYDLATPLIRTALENPDPDPAFQAWAINDYAEIMLGLGRNDSATHFAGKALEIGQVNNIPDQVYRSYRLLSQGFEVREMKDSALYYYKQATIAKDSLFSAEKTKQLQSIRFEEELRQQDIEQQKAQWISRVKMYGLLGGLILITVVTIMLYRNNRHKQRVNSKLEQTLSELRATQAQLIQSEKMASLGELTAGIAHEIQNPLNFVNNFSELNLELAEELKTELAAGNLQSATDILNNIKDNSEKINQHGRRADAIVKGMLQHSRASSGHKELTDINALADECLRLSYHGMRAKDKSFNAATEMQLDENLPKVKIASQDIGRVMLNLFTNAFFSVMQKRKRVGESFTPAVSVRTAHSSNSVSIAIRDNGDGIPRQVIDKIFQPFFTTKPSGQGTGLGLSISYDIVTKGHGGELKVDTREGEYAEFTIILPL